MRKFLTRNHRLKACLLQPVPRNHQTDPDLKPNLQLKPKGEQTKQLPKQQHKPRTKHSLQNFADLLEPKQKAKSDPVQNLQRSLHVSRADLNR